MKKLAAALSLLFLSGWSSAVQLSTVFNPFTGKLDYINVATMSVVASTNTINIQNTLQAGATFFVSSGTVAGPFTTTGNTVIGNNAAVVTIPNLGNGGGGQRFVEISTTIAGNPIVSGFITAPDIPAGSGNYVQNISSLQSGATFYVSSGTLAGNFIIGSSGYPNSAYINYSGSGFSAFSSPSPTVFPIGTLTLTKQSLSGSPTGFRFDNPNTGSWVAGFDTINASPISKIASTLIISSATTITGGATIDSMTVTSTAAASAVILTGQGNAVITEGNGVQGQVVVTTGTGFTVGHCLQAGSSMTAVDAGAACGTGGGGGTPATPFNAVQYNNAGSFGGSNLFTFTPAVSPITSSITVVSSMTISQSAIAAGHGFSLQPILGVFGTGGVGLTTDSPLLEVGGDATTNMLTVRYNDLIDMSASGARIGNLQIGGRSDGDAVGDSLSLLEVPNTSGNQGIKLFDGSGNIDVLTASVGNGGKNGTINLQVGGNTEVAVSSFGMTVSTGMNLTVASMTVNGLNYQWPSSESFNYLRNDGSGNLSWVATPTSSASGVVGPNPYSQIPFYSVQGSSNVLTSSANFTNNGTTVTLSNISVVTQTNVTTVTATGVFYNYLTSSMTISSETITSTGTAPALSIFANGTYGTTNGSSGGLFLNCTGGLGGSGYCSQFYTNAGAQSALGGVLNIIMGNSAWNEPGLYIQNTANTSNNNSDILVDDNFTPAITIRETVQGNPSSEKWQFSAHGGVFRLENRANNDSGFLPWMQVSSQTFWNDIYVGNTYGNQNNNTQFQVQSSSGNVYVTTLSTAAVSPFFIDVSTTGHLNAQKVTGSTITSCGTNPVLSGSDIAGSITTGSGSPTACTLTFNRPYSNTPICLCGANGATACDPTSISPTAVTFTLGVTETSIKYICIGSD